MAPDREDIVMTSDKKFLPPYLRYGVAADEKKIAEQIKAMGDAAAASMSLPDFGNIPVSFGQSKFTRVATNFNFGDSAAAQRFEVRQTGAQFTGLDIVSDSIPFRDAGSRATAIGQFTSTSDSIPTTNTGAAAAATSKVAQIGYCSVSPNGTVSLGFNCRRTFTASADIASTTTHTIWKLFMKNQNSGEFDQIYFLGGLSQIDKKKKISTVDFDHDFGTYRDAAYASTNKTAIFKVEVTPYFLFDALAPAYSDEITLDFSPQSCIGIHSVSLSTNSVKGAGNQKEPTLTVALTAPAGPGGQKVALSTDDKELGWIMGSGSFMIAAGQTSGSISWFLGTKNVGTTGKSFNIVAELVSPNGNSGKAYAKMKLTK